MTYYDGNAKSLETCAYGYKQTKGPVRSLIPKHR